MGRSIINVVFVIVLLLASCGGRKDNIQTVSSDQKPDKLSELLGRAEREPGNAMVYNELALYYLSQDLLNNALSSINKSLQIEPQNPVHFVTLADIYLMMGDADRAQLTLYRALDIEPNNAELYVHIGRMHVYMEDYPRAFENLRRALDLDRNNSKAYYWRGVARLETGDTTRAINDWQLAVANDPESFEGYFQLGMLMAERNDRFASDYLEHALRLAPPDADLMYDIGMAFQNIERFNKSVETYQRILEIDSCYFKAWYNIGYLNLVEFNEYAVAADYFSKALRCKPDYADAIFNRGLAYELLGDFSNARNDYQATLRILVNYPKAIDALNRLDSLQIAG